VVFKKFFSLPNSFAGRDLYHKFGYGIIPTFIKEFLQGKELLVQGDVIGWHKRMLAPFFLRGLKSTFIH
jgi:hypothetical protein